MSIIVPVYNEVRTVRAVLDRLLSIDLPVERDVVVVDDGSTDGTGEMLATAVREGLPITLLRAARNRGKGSAIRLGLEHARGTIVAIQDADLELDPTELRLLVQPILNAETTVVFGSRFLHGRPPVPLLSLAANRALTAVTNILYRTSLTDMETCYKVMRMDVARSLGLRADRFDIEPEITAKLLLAGHRIHELPIRFEPRSRLDGKKIRWRDGVHALWVLLSLRCRGAR